MKQVYLIPPKEKRGPFEVIEEDGPLGPRVMIDSSSPTFYALESLGYTIEEALPQEITITERDLKRAVTEFDIRFGVPHNLTLWQKLREIAGEK